MNESLITVRYAKALYELAIEEKKEIAIQNDVETLLESVSKSEEFSAFLENPLIKGSEKARIINSLFKGRIDPISLNFLHLLIENKREECLGGICRYIIRLIKQKSGIQDAVLTTAQKLPEKHKKEIFEFVTKKFKLNLDMQEKIDPEIIGGYILRIEDQQIDASLKNQLNKIKRELINS